MPHVRRERGADQGCRDQRDPDAEILEGVYSPALIAFWHVPTHYVALIALARGAAVPPVQPGGGSVKGAAAEGA